MLSSLSKIGYSPWDKDYALAFTMLDVGLKVKDEKTRSELVDRFGILCEKNQAFLEAIHKILAEKIEKEKTEISETLDNIKYIDENPAYAEKTVSRIKGLSHKSIEELQNLLDDDMQSDTDDQKIAAAITIKKCEENIKILTEFGEAILKKVGVLQIENATQEQSPLFSSNRR